MLGYAAHHALRRRWPARRHDPDPVHGERRPELRRVRPVGITLRLVGDANDYLGKGLSVAGSSSHRRLTRRSGPRTTLWPQRHPVRRTRARSSSAAWSASGSACATPAATAVVEGVGDHGCEYMTVGASSCSDPTGRNFRCAGCRADRRTCTTRTAVPRSRQSGDGGLDRSRTRTGSSCGHDPPSLDETARRSRGGSSRSGAARSSTSPSDAQDYNACSKRPASRGAGTVGGRSDHGGLPWVRSPGFLKYDRELAGAGVRCRCGFGTGRVYEPFAPDRLRTQAARCMDAASRSVTTGCPSGT